MAFTKMLWKTNIDGFGIKIRAKVKNAREQDLKVVIHASVKNATSTSSNAITNESNS